jgi:hypothetical protein
MSDQVVIPFRAPRGHRRHVASAGERSERGRRASGWVYRLATAREMVRAVVETLSYVGDARVRPPAALPPKRQSA